MTGWTTGRGQRDALAGFVISLLALLSSTIHLFLMLYPLLLLVDGYRPDPKYLPGVLGFLIGAAIPIYFLNKVCPNQFSYFYA